MTNAAVDEACIELTSLLKLHHVIPKNGLILDSALIFTVTDSSKVQYMYFAILLSTWRKLSDSYNFLRRGLSHLTIVKSVI